MSWLLDTRWGRATLTLFSTGAATCLYLWTALWVIPAINRADTPPVVMEDTVRWALAIPIAVLEVVVFAALCGGLFLLGVWILQGSAKGGERYDRRA